MPLCLIVEEDYWVVWNDMVGPFPVKAERTCGLVGDSVEHNGMQLHGDGTIFCWLISVEFSSNQSKVFIYFH